MRFKRDPFGFSFCSDSSCVPPVVEKISVCVRNFCRSAARSAMDTLQDLQHSGMPKTNNKNGFHWFSMVFSGKTMILRQNVAPPPQR